MGAAVATASFGNTPKTPQSPVPNVEASVSSPATRDHIGDAAIESPDDGALASPAELALPEKAAASALTVEKTLPDQTLSDQLAAKKAEQQKLAAQKAQAQRVARQRAAAQKLAAQKAAAKKALAAKPVAEKQVKTSTPTLGVVSTEVEGDMT